MTEPVCHLCGNKDVTVIREGIGHYDALIVCKREHYTARGELMEGKTYVLEGEKEKEK